MELIFLGTSAGKPTKTRNVSGILLNLIQERKSLWLFDCGEATQHQLAKTQFNVSKLEMIFITHLHGDHLFGLPGILTSRSLMNGMKPLTIFAPKGIKAFLDISLITTDSHLNYPLNIIELEQDRVIFQDKQFTIEAKQLSHRTISFGYRIVEADKLGALDADRLKADNIKVGTLYGQLKNGETVTLEDGRVIHGADYLAPQVQGKKIAILGDTQPTKASVVLANGVDLLVHEATYDASLADKAELYGHSTTIQAATIAKQSCAKKLIITHISSRYSSYKESEHLVDECRTVFPNTEIASDFSVFKI